MKLFSIFNRKNGEEPRIEEGFKGQPSNKSVWAVGGGKGGVGKSFIASNMAILLSMEGQRVLLVDADFGAANLHTFLGEVGSAQPFSSFIKGKIDDIKAVISPTRIEGLDIISGSKDSLGAANLDEGRTERIKKALCDLDYDHVVIDMSPGTHNNALDMFLTANGGLLVITPEPTSVENAYRFIKCLLLRRIKKINESDEGSELRSLLQKILYDRKGGRSLTIAALLEELKRLDPKASSIMTEMMKDTSLHIVVNQARRPEDRTLGNSIERACQDFFGLKIGFLGHVSYGECVYEAIRSGKPFVLNHRESEPARDMEAIRRRMIEKSRARACR